MMRVHIVTGATGYLGSHFAFELLRAYPRDIVICLARGTVQEPAEYRVRRSLRIAARTSGALLARSEQARLRCIDLNPLQENANGTTAVQDGMQGLPASARRMFWHIAASVSFVESESGELHRTNYEGTAHCLDLACAIGAHEFNYVSTAYVSGDRSGRIEAELADSPPQFNNPYEASKFAAEHMVRRTCAERGMPMRIFRPSIIVGHSATRLTSSDSGMYKYAELLLEFWETLRTRERRNAVAEIKLRVPRDTTLNLVPIDVCAREMLAVAHTKASLGGVYHVTSKDRIPTRYFHEVFSELTGIPVVTVDPDDDSSKLSRLDIEIGRRLSHYSPYLVSDKQFMRDSVLACSDEDLQKDTHVDKDAMRGWLSRYLADLRTRSLVTADAQLFAAQSGVGAEFNVAGWLVRTIREQRRSGLAVRSELEDISYTALADRICATAAVLAGRGIAAGRRVALMCSDSVSSVVAMVGAMYAGAVVVQINPLVQAGEAASMLKQADACHLVADADVAEKMRAINWNGDILTLDALARATQDTMPADCEAVLLSAHAHAFGVFTSGSTGQPKLVLHAHMDFRVATDRYAAQMLDVKSSDVVFSASRLCFAFGLQNLFIALSHGATAVLPPRTINAETIALTINHHEPSIIFAVPTIYQMLLNRRGDGPRLQTRSLRACIAAGEHLPEEIGRRWEKKFGLPILDSLGSSEVFSTYLSNIHGVPRPGATGKLVPGFDAMLSDESGVPCKTGESGILWIRGPSVIPAYGNAPSAPDNLFRNGWFCTKDVFWRDADGYFYYRGRQSEMFKVAGQWISPTEIEAVLLRHPRVLEAAVTAVGDESATTRPSVFIVASPGPLEGLDEDIKQFCKRELESWKYPHFVHFVPSLPRTLTGKLRRFALTADHAMSAVA